MKGVKVDNVLKVVTALLIMYTLAMIYMTRVPLKDINAVANRRPSLIGYVLDSPDTDMQHIQLSFEQMQKLQQLRKIKLKRACKKTGYHSSLYHEWDAYFDKKRKFVYCPIPRNAAESWKEVILKNHENAKTDPSREKSLNYLLEVEHLSAHRTWQLMNEVNPTMSFVFVRDPWLRLVSAYRAFSEQSDWFRLHRDPCKWQERNVTFNEFITCIASQVNLEETRSGLNNYWKPQTMFCNICDLEYSHIAHMETFDADMLYIMSLTGMIGRFPHTNQSNKLTMMVAKSYYKHLSKKLVDEIVKIYWYDFELLGYSKTPPGW